MTDISNFDNALKCAKENTNNPRTLQHIERRAELGVVEGNCTYFIRRKQRFCSHRAAAGSIDGRCSEHTEGALEESRKRDLQARAANAASSAADTSPSRCDTENESSSKAGSSKSLRVSAPKRMANPFSVDLNPDIGKPNWKEIFSDACRPMHIDVGCAKGRCVERLSKRKARHNWNQLGVEIRPDIVNCAVERANESDCENRNLHFIACNFSASIHQLFDSMPDPHCVRLISFQFPDPWRRGKHIKRLIVQPKLVKSLTKYLTEGALVYISTDCEDVAERIRFEFLHAFSSSSIDDAGNGEDGSESNGDRISNNQRKRKLASSMLSLASGSQTADSGPGPAYELVRERDIVHMFGDSTGYSRGSADLRTMTEGALFVLDNGSDDGAENDGTILTSVQSSGNRDEGVNATEQRHRDRKLSEGASDPTENDDEFWLKRNPLLEPSERELVCENAWKRVWRCVFRRTAWMPPDI
jgi:tRNA (guanine-N7-)-methyltransferase